MGGLCRHGVPPRYRCYDCEPERSMERKDRVERERRCAASMERLRADRAKAGKGANR